MSKLHIFTLSWNGEDKLIRLKKTLEDSLRGIDYHWHIKSNGCKDNTVATVNSWGENVTCYAYKNNAQNFSEGNNYLYSLIKPNDDDFILLLNNDVIFNDKKSLKKMVQLFNKEENVGVVGAKLKYFNSDKVQHAGVVFSESSRRLPFHYRAGQTEDKQSSTNREFQVVTGAVLLTKASYYKNICNANKSGICGMDEGFVWSFDDVDLCLNIKYVQGKRILYCGQTNISHEESVTLKKNPSNKLFMHHNMNRLLEKWHSSIDLDLEKYEANLKYNLVRTRA